MIKGRKLEVQQSMKNMQWSVMKVWQSAIKCKKLKKSLIITNTGTIYPQVII